MTTFQNHMQNLQTSISAKTQNSTPTTKKEINYFDTPYDRRRGVTGMANLMKGILADREKEREASKNFISSKIINDNINNRED